MSEAGGSGEVVTSPLRLEELLALRSDYVDVPVPSLGGRTFRVYALSGLARAKLVPLMADVASRDSKDPGVVRVVFEYQYKAVAASLGYPEEEWDAVGSTLGADAVEALYGEVSKLSGLGEAAEGEATARLGRARKPASGTGSPSPSATGPSGSAS